VSIQHIASCRLPTASALFELHGFQDTDTGAEHLAMTLGEIGDGIPVLCRVHSECMTGDALFSQRCDCGAQLAAALERIASQGRGVLLYLRQEGRGIGLINKIRAYQLQDGGADTVDANLRLGFLADLRSYDMCAGMLARLGVNSVQLLTNNPRKVLALADAGVHVVERIGLVAGHNQHNRHYLAVKAARMGHLFDAPCRLAGQTVLP
jgi:GTP cyclohydrolase II